MQPALGHATKTGADPAGHVGLKGNLAADPVLTAEDGDRLQHRLGATGKHAPRTRAGDQLLLENAGNQPPRAERAVIGGNVGVNAEPLEFGDAQHVFLPFAADEHLDRGRAGKLPGEEIERRKAEPSSHEQFLRPGITFRETVAQWAQNIHIIAGVQRGQYSRALADDFVEYLEIVLLRRIRILGRKTAHVINAEWPPEQRVNAILHANHDELAGFCQENGLRRGEPYQAVAGRYLVV